MFQNRLGAFLADRGLDFRGLWPLLRKQLQRARFIVFQAIFGPESFWGRFLAVWRLDFRSFGSLPGQWSQNYNFIAFRVAFGSELLRGSFWPLGAGFSCFYFPAKKVAPAYLFHCVLVCFLCRIVMGIFLVVRAIGTYVFYSSFGSPAIGTYVFCSILQKPSDRNLHILRTLWDPSDMNLCILQHFWEPSDRNLCISQHF